MMNKDEAEKRANELLTGYAQQTWRWHTPHEEGVETLLAKARIIKNAEEFAAMLLRRGYRLEEAREEPTGMLYRFVVGSGSQFAAYCFTSAPFLYRTVAEVAEELDRYVAAGRHHVCCAQCQEPLLLHVKYVDEQQQAEKWRGYRSAKAGPHSDLLTVCPGCQVPLSAETVQEIVDAN